MPDKNKIEGIEGTVAPEKTEQVLKLAKDIIEPALQKALGEAREKGTAQEVVSALANCYGGLLVDLLGRKGAASLLQSHAIHIASLEESPLND